MFSLMKNHGEYHALTILSRSWCAQGIERRWKTAQSSRGAYRSMGRSTHDIFRLCDLDDFRCVPKKLVLDAEESSLRDVMHYAVMSLLSLHTLSARQYQIKSSLFAAAHARMQGTSETRSQTSCHSQMSLQLRISPRR